MRRESTTREFRAERWGAVSGRAWHIEKISPAGESVVGPKPHGPGFRFISVDTRRMRILYTPDANRFRDDLADMTLDDFVVFLAKSKLNGIDRRAPDRS